MAAIFKRKLLLFWYLYLDFFGFLRSLFSCGYKTASEIILAVEHVLSNISLISAWNSQITIKI